MMRFWFPCLLLAMLGGCFTSETPRIPITELSRPAGFEGPFWYISLQNDSGPMAYLVDISAREGRGFQQSRGDSARFRLVRLKGDTVYLFISDTEQNEEKDDNLSTYYLLQRRQGGAWEWDDISVNYARPFAQQNTNYLDEVTARHGLKLDSPEERTRIEGPVHGVAIPQLFRDPAFLGALLVNPVGAYLPARSNLVQDDGVQLGQSARIGFELELSSKLVPSDRMLEKPAGFAGSYHLSAGDTGTDARIDARTDGRFELHSGGKIETIALLAFDEKAQTYLGIRDWDFASGGETEHHTGLLIVSRTDDGWVFESIAARPSAGSKELDAMSAELAAEALRRHGLAITDGKIGGTLEAERLLALLHDGEFTSGLAIDDRPVTLHATRRR